VLNEPSRSTAGRKVQQAFHHGSASGDAWHRLGFCHPFRVPHVGAPA
jgi:hypothetical protein